MVRQTPFTFLEHAQWDALVERLHRLFMANLDDKTFDLYIEPHVKDRDTGVEYSAFERLTAFMHDKNSASLLLAGEPGMGKTLLSLHIAQQTWCHFIKANLGGLLNVTNPYWQMFLTPLEAQGFSLKQDDEKETAGPDNCLPLWMWMPFVRMDANWKIQLLEAYARQNHLFSHEIQLLRDACQLKICRLCPIMDGWDELPPGVVTENLYLSSGFWADEGWPYIKVLSTCRPEAFIHYEKSQGSYRSIFHPPQGTGQYTILNLSPFESNHIHSYVTRYVESLSSDYVPSTLPLFAPSEESFVDEAKEAWVKDYEKYTVNTVRAGRLSIPEEKQEKKETPESLEIQLTLSAPQLSPEAVNWHCPTTYLNYLKHIHGLNELVKTPFILSAVVQVLPTIVLHEQRYQKHDISRYIIYQYFIEHWLIKQATRLWADREKRECLAELKGENEKASIHNLKECLLTYSENLARLALNIGEGKINVNLSERDTSHSSLVIPPPGQTPYFEKEPVAQEKLHLIRSGCLLQTIGNHFKFLHKSLVEYFAAKVLFNGAHRAAASYLNRFGEHHSFKDLDLNEHLLTTEPSVIYLLADKAREDIHFKYLLYQMIELSKGEPSVANAAANAITILNAAGESFSGRDFRGVHIAGALLNGALCDHANFEGADLSDVTFQHACLPHTNLSHAKVRGLDFQELPRIKHTSPITTLLVASSGQWLLVGDMEGYVTQYSYPAGKMLQQWYRTSEYLTGKAAALVGVNPVMTLALHPNEKLAACGGLDGTAQLIDIEHNHLGTRFIPAVMDQATFLQFNLSDSSSMTFCSEGGAFLAFNSRIELKSFVIYNTRYYANHLQLWDVRQKCFLGEYQSEDGRIEPLAACHHGQTLIAQQNNKVLIFFIASYKGGDLVPTRTLDCQGSYSISQDERLLALFQNNTIQLYQTQEWQPLNTISLQGKSRNIEALAFSSKGDLLAGCTATQLDFWDLSSRQHLYTLPRHEGENLIETKNQLHFIPHCESLRMGVAVNDTLYFWPLNRAGASIAYPQQTIDLWAAFLEKTTFEHEIHNDDLLIQVNHEKKSITTIQYTLDIYHKTLQKAQHLSYQVFNIDSNSQELALSPNQAYLITREKIASNTMRIISMFGLAGSIFNKVGKDRSIRIWDVKQGQLYWKITNPLPWAIIMFSMDSKWLVHGCEDVFIHRLKDKKRLLTLKIGHLVTALALAADKSWLAVANEKGSLLLYDIQTQQLAYRLRNLPIIIRNIDITVDAQYLVARGSKEGALTFRIWREKDGMQIKLVHNSIALNLACARIKLEGTHGLSADNLQLLQQNNAFGKPASLNHPQAQNIYAAASVVPREISFKTAVVKREQVKSCLNTRALLDYSLWQVGLVRDANSNQHNQHVFIIVEGMDAYGRCFFWRFDFVTKAREKKVQEGFAKVVINKRENLVLSERAMTLEEFLNPHEIKDRGLMSLVGQVWPLKREVILQLYRDVLKDKEAGLLPYAPGGNLSFFGRAGDNCYSWGRRHLLALKQEEIEKQLPSSFMDFIAIVPSFKLHTSLASFDSKKEKEEVHSIDSNFSSHSNSEEESEIDKRIDILENKIREEVKEWIASMSQTELTQWLDAIQEKQKELQSQENQDCTEDMLTPQFDSKRK